MSTIFHIDEYNKAVQLHESKYESEDLLQQLVEQHPDILAGEQMNPENPRKWILISREMGVPGHEGGSDQWFLDHLFIDQDGIPTFVEVKRSTDTRIRREVVAQMLDYAANATAYWPATRLREAFEEHNADSSSVLYENLGIAPEDEDAFWEKVDSNLRLGKLRLLFVADEIPETLQRIIEFLNGQMVDAEVLGLEIKQYVSDSNQRTLVPKLVGRTSASVQVKKTQDFEWTEELFLDRVQSVSGESAKEVCVRLLRDFRDMGCYIRWGKGLAEGGFTPVYVGKKNYRISPVYSYKTATKIELPFSEFKAPFDKIEKKKALITEFNSIEELNIPDNPKRPSFDCKILIDDSAYARFIAICKKMISDICTYEECSL